MASEAENDVSISHKNAIELQAISLKESSKPRCAQTMTDVESSASGLFFWCSFLFRGVAAQLSSSCCCSNPNEGTLLLYISVYAVSVDVLTRAVDLHKTASR